MLYHIINKAVVLLIERLAQRANITRDSHYVVPVFESKMIPLCMLIGKFFKHLVVVLLCSVFYVTTITNRSIKRFLGGSYSFIVKVSCGDMEALERLITLFQKAGPTSTQIILSTPVDRKPY